MWIKVKIIFKDDAITEEYLKRNGLSKFDVAQKYAKAFENIDLSRAGRKIPYEVRVDVWDG